MFFTTEIFMTAQTIEIKAALADDDRKLLKSVLAALTKAGGKTATAKDSADDSDGEEDSETEEEADFEGDGETEAEEKPERSDVHAALKTYANAIGSQAKAIELMKKHGGTEKLSALKEDKFAAVIDAAKKATAKAKK